MAGSARAARKLARASARQTVLQASAKRAVGYARVSTEDQANNGSSIETQTELIKAFARSQGYDLVEIFTDPGVSGSTLPADRPGFAELLRCAIAESVAVLLVWRFDRLARNQRHAINTVHDELNARDIQLRSVTEAAVDTGSSMGKMLFGILASLAEGERETIKLRTQTGRIAKGQKGGIACGKPPFGYRRRQDGSLEVVAAEATIVRLMFQLREDGLFLHDIADRLNAMGVRGRGGGIWRKGTVQACLDNQKYRGALEYLFTQGDELVHVHVPGAVEAIV